MIQTVKAVVEKNGRVRLLKSLKLPQRRPALVTILDEEALGGIAETALLSEAALAKDWSRPEEDEAWSYLQQAR